MSTNVSKAAKKLQQAIEKKDKSSALSTFKSGIRENESCFIARLRKDGVLRCSKYDFQSQIIIFLLNETKSINIKSDSKSYFKSLSALLSISREVQDAFKSLKKEVGVSEFKSYLVSVDSLFWAESKIDSESLGLSKEDLASAFSLYLYYSHDAQILRKASLGSVNKSKINRKYYLNKLKDFSKIDFFRECEILLDCFGFSATQNGERVILTAPHENFEKSIVLGYTGYLSQSFADMARVFSEENKRYTSIVDFARAFYDEFGDATFKVREKPSRRITMEFRATEALQKALNGNHIFLEEIAILQQIEKELFVNLEEVDNFSVYKSLSLFDIIKVQRLFAFIFLLFGEYIERHALHDSKLFWQSILPVFPEDEFKGLLSIYFGESRAKEIFELLAWNPQKKRILDLQTYPFISIEDWIALPLGTLSNSNLCRNVLQSERIRLDATSLVDPITSAMEKCLKLVASVLKRNLSYNFEGKAGEVDVLAVVGDCLFVFECKNSLHPCNTFELRTTYDYVQKAAGQLSNFQSLWQKESFRNYIASKIQVQNLPLKFCTCIVLGNRMFSGWNEQGHSVRPVHELSNFIRTGKIILSSYDLSSKEKENILSFKLWKDEEMSTEDLLAYIQTDSLHKCYFDSMETVQKTVKFKKRSLTQESFVFDQSHFFQKLEEEFQYV